MELIFNNQTEAFSGVEKTIKSLQNKAIKKGKTSFFILVFFRRIEGKIVCNISTFKSVDEKVLNTFGCWTTLQETFYCPATGVWKNIIHFQTFQEEICAHICSLSNSEFEQLVKDAKSDIEKKTLEDSRGLLNNGIFS